MRMILSRGRKLPWKVNGEKMILGHAPLECVSRGSAAMPVQEAFAHTAGMGALQAGPSLLLLPGSLPGYMPVNE